ncbi:MAG TPA: ABC-F family ATP-binding cassette domain-containing protein [Thermoanaerobaculia bacterium]|nr:ABC-F family ATP-binding cassette domain-containing protein [Thermoanaerobaculia bacterium]
MLAVSNLAKYFGEQTLFENVSFQLNAGERYGVVGANGSGKSTLLRILSGREIASEGTVSFPKRARLGVLEQDHFRYEDVPILDVVMMGNAELWAAMSEKEELLERADREFDADRYAELEDVILRHDGYALEARAAEILEGLGIPTERHREPLSALSGGFKLRVLLAQVLAAHPDILLLDEPTNHLDILSIRWLEKFLEGYTGCSVVVSHDHRFLDNVCTFIVDVDYGTATLYHGNYTAFEEQKIEERERREREIDKRQREIDEHQAFVDRFRAKATKARQAQSKIKLIEKINIEPLPQSSRRYPTFGFRQRRPSGKQVLEVKGISKAYDGMPVLEEVTLEVRRGERVAIIGPNGIGKSTLLKIAIGQVKADRGEVEWGYETRFGYFAQDHKEQLGTPRQTVEAWLWDVCPAEPIGFVRSQLGAVLFSGDEVKKKVGSLSGGEAARLIFARHVVEKPNVLVLDEPTNHLDLEAIEALVAGLRAFEGTLIFVSHDRWLVGELATRIVEISPRGINDYHGTYEEYVERCGDDHLDSEAVLKKARAAKRAEKARAEQRAARPDAETRKRRRAVAQQLEEVTRAIEKAEARVHEINETFCDPTFFERSEPSKVKKLETEQKDLGARVAELMTEWERLEEEKAELEPA